MDQFESRQQRSTQQVKKLAESLTSKTSKLNLNVPPPKSGNTEGVKDPVQLSTGKRVGISSSGDKQLAGQLTKDQVVLDNVTLAVRELLTHPVGARPSENARLAQDRQRLEQSKELRKKADTQATRNQQGLDSDRQQERQRQQGRQGTAAERAVQGAAQQNRDSSTNDLARAQAERTRVVTQQMVRENIERNIVEGIQRAEAAVQERAEVSRTASALAERNASREGLQSLGTQDLVRGMTDGSKSSSEAKLPHVAELSPGAALAVSLSSVVAQHGAAERENRARQEEISQEIFRADQKVSQMRQQETFLQEELDGLEEEDSLFERRKQRRTSVRRLAKKLERKKRRLTPLERRRARIRREKMKRMRSRRTPRARLLVFR